MDADQIRAALKAASSAHHEFETVALGGVRDELWAGFYAAYVLGRLGDFMEPSALASLLEEVEGEDWFEAATGAVVAAAASR